MLYISSCSGAASGGRRDLLYNDVLGLAHGAVAAGVPTVLGFRWPVLDPCARLLATSFYKALLETGRPDEALRTARLTVREEYEDTKYEDDQAWLSPVLIMQP